jgi:hypothetical protein
MTKSEEANSIQAVQSIFIALCSDGLTEGCFCIIIISHPSLSSSNGDIDDAERRRYRKEVKR